MSTDATTAPATALTEHLATSSAPETSAAVVTDTAAPAASDATIAAEAAARPPVTAPEHTATAEQQAEAIMPKNPEILLPTAQTTTHIAAPAPAATANDPAAPAANDPLAALVATAEQEAAKKIGADIAALNANGANIATDGLTVTLTVGNSNAPATHACTGGANCAHCTATKEAPQAAPAEASIAETAAPATAEAAPSESTAPMADQSTVEQAKPEIKPVATGLTIDVPAVHAGMAANAPTIAKTA